MDIHLETDHSTAVSSVFWCCFYGAGIILTLLVYGLQQERVMQVPYGGELFQISAFLVFANRISNLLFGFVMSIWAGETLQNQAPFWAYLLVSFSNVGATVYQYEALKYVSFAVQMLGKSFKMMPVMIWGILVSRKMYSAMDWLIAAAVTGGVTMFLMSGPTSAPESSNSSVHGLLLLCCFLALDGLTSTMQEKLFRDYRTSKYNQILYVNLSSAVVSFATLLATGTMGEAFGFCGAHSGFVKDLVLLSCSATAGQWFIYSQVQNFGALALAATMNVRQVVSIVFSYVEYGHIITNLQTLAFLIVFTALFYKSYLGLIAPRTSREFETKGEIYRV